MLPAKSTRLRGGGVVDFYPMKTNTLFFKLGLGLTLGLLSVSCSSKKTTAEAKSELDSRWTKKVGSATKSEFIEEFGHAEWCKAEAGGGETCRFFMKKGIRWAGDKTEKKAIVQYDEVVASFDPAGHLREFKTNAQR